jgi:hypothetical protein
MLRFRRQFQHWNKGRKILLFRSFAQQLHREVVTHSGVEQKLSGG